MRIFAYMFTALLYVVFRILHSRRSRALSCLIQPDLPWYIFGVPLQYSAVELQVNWPFVACIQLPVIGCEAGCKRL